MPWKKGWAVDTCPTVELGSVGFEPQLASQLFLPAFPLLRPVAFACLMAELLRYVSGKLVRRPDTYDLAAGHGERFDAVRQEDVASVHIAQRTGRVAMLPYAVVFDSKSLSWPADVGNVRPSVTESYDTSALHGGAWLVEHTFR